MAVTITISERQFQQFNKMRNALHRIARGYQTPKQIRRSSENDIGLEYAEALEYAYENIQAEASAAIKGVSALSEKGKQAAAEFAEGRK